MEKLLGDPTQEADDLLEALTCHAQVMGVRAEKELGELCMQLLSFEER